VKRGFVPMPLPLRKDGAGSGRIRGGWGAKITKGTPMKGTMRKIIAPGHR